MKNNLKICHYVRLAGSGGVQQQFVDFVKVAEDKFGWQSAIIPNEPAFSDAVRARCSAIDDLAKSLEDNTHNFAGNLLRSKGQRWRAWQKRQIKSSNAQVLLFWDRLGGRGAMRALRTFGSEKCLYWEHSTAWAHSAKGARRQFLHRMPAAIVNSLASKRMLQLKWGYSGPTRIIWPGLRSSLNIMKGMERTAPKTSWQLGSIARLVPQKGVAVTLHAVAILLKKGLDVSLQIAGDGPEASALHALATDLGIDKRVEFLGNISDVDSFYQHIDLLVHPALSEAFGTINTEAAAYGVPAITAAVDGLPEAVLDGVTGCVVPPTESMAVYKEMSGSSSDMFELVYDPIKDELTEPKAILPSSLAASIEDLMHDPQRYECMSQAGIMRAKTEFDFTHTVEKALLTLDEFIATGTLAVGDANRVQ